ncbi:MAG: tetratricopeptide repeat protein [Bacteroidetes bacterium]|nr:MAG: tetratricopeptide repeat protein [Bacteroidota bacterium]
MAASKKRRATPAQKQRPPQTDKTNTPSYSFLLWLIVFGTSVFLIPQCLDRYLVSRFFFLSVVLFFGIWWWRKTWQRQEDWTLRGFDLLLLVWYALNAASVAWAFSWSEAVFFTQKVWLFLGVYWVVRQALAHDVPQFRRTLASITQVLTFIMCAILLVQVGIGFREHGLDNKQLYNYASAISGNKGLASDLLFFLLALHVLLRREIRSKTLFWTAVGLLAFLILILQTRTVYLAVVLGSILYISGRALLEPDFRPFFFKRILPGAGVGLIVLVGLLSWKGQGSSLAQRLNPATYLESASALERRFVWARTDMLNQDHYWWGVGNGSWKILFPSKSLEGGYRLQEKNIVFTRAHNDYLEIRSEMGLVGAILYSLLFLTAFGAAILAIRRTNDPQERHDLLVLMAGVLGYCVIQYFDFPRERIEMQVILALLLAYLTHHSRAVWDKLPTVPATKMVSPAIVLFLLGLAFNMVIGWNRIWGEIHNVNILKAMNQGNYKAVQQEAGAAKNAFYEYNDVALPLSWFEGIAFYQLGQPQEAIAAFEDAYRLNPWAFQVLNNYGTALVQAKRYAEAITLYEKALEINPKYNEGKFNIAYCLYEQRQLDPALEWLSRIDTLKNPETPEEQAKNQAVLQQKAGLETAIKQQKMKNSK